ncbi:MAG: phage tail tape measure protein [Syntrophaceae bacterium]|nr:phage tail tape measure protein [Syntrophaceae bacterium]
MAENEVKLRITTDASGAVTGIEQVRSSMQKLQKSAEGISAQLKGLLSFTIAGVGLYQMVSVGKDLAELGAKAQQAEESFRLMAESVGINAEQMYQAMKTASRGIMDDSDLMQKAAKGIAQGLRSDELVAIAQGARYAARLAGEDVKTAYETITDAIANQMPKALRRYGLVTKEEMSLLNRAMAAGVEDIRLADIALANLAIQTGRFGTEAETAYESMQRLRAEWNNMKEQAGKGIVAVVDVIYRTFLQRSPGEAESIAGIDAFGRPVDMGKTEYRGKITAERPYDPYSEGNLLRAEAERDKFWAVEKMKTAIAEKENQKRLEEIARLNEHIEDMWARQVLTVEEQATRQADIWRRKGADRVLVEEWLANELERIRISEDARLTERLSKIYEREQKNALAIAEIYADTEARSAISRLNFQKQILSEKEGLGLMTASERLLAEHDLARKILEAEESRLRVLLTRKSQHITEDDLEGQREILKLALEHKEISQQILETEELRVLRLKEFQGGFAEGLDAGARKYFSEIEGSFRRGRTQAEQTARGMEQAFSDGFFAVFTGQVDRLEDVWTNFCHSMARAWSDTLAQMVMESLKGSGGGLFGGLDSILSGAESFDLFALLGGGSGMFFEEGGIFSAGRLVPFAAGGIVERPTVFRMASGMGLMGEEGPEAVMPLGRTASGELGVKGMGSGGVVIVNNIRAIDTQSFADVCRRNPQAITQTVSSEMKDGKLKHWKPFMGG